MTVQPAICAQLQFHRVHIFLQPVLHFFEQPSHFCVHGCLGAIWLGPNMSPLAPCYLQAPTQLWQACQKHCHQALHRHWTIHLRRRTADLDKNNMGSGGLQNWITLCKLGMAMRIFLAMRCFDTLNDQSQFRFALLQYFSDRSGITGWLSP